MSVRHAPSTEAPATAPKRLDAVLRAGLERKVASLSLVSIDAKEERQGAEARKEQRSTPYGIRRRKQPLASNEELMRQQRQFADRLLKKRPVVRTQDRDVDDEAVRPLVVRSDNAEHRRIFAVVCYTRTFDRMLVAMVKDPKMTPYKLYKESPWMLGTWSRVMPALAFFERDSLSSVDAGAARVEAVSGCYLMNLTYEDKEKENEKMISLSDLGHSYSQKDYQGTPIVPDKDDLYQLAWFVNDGITHMMLEFKRSFAPWAQWASTSVGGMASFNDQSFMSGSCKARNLLFSGNRVSPVDPNRLSKRMISTSYALDSAVSFATPVGGMESKGTLMVFVVDLNVEVVNVNAATSTVGEEFMCYSHECEIVVEAGCKYARLDNLDDYPVHKEEWEKALAEFDEAPQKDDSVRPDVAFFLVMSPRQLRST